ncbi:MAG: hypothetical protein EU541_07280, partial [Promethearchaeota archaeon]
MNKESSIYFNGSIITLEEETPNPEAVGIKGDKIFKVGSLKSVKEAMGTSVTLIDLNRRTLLPGFIDSHLHPIMYLFFLINPELSKINSMAELQRVLREAAKNNDPDELLLGLRLKEENFDTPRLPTRWDIDKACPDTPVFVLRYDGHIGILNSMGLDFVGIDETTPAPEGGEIRRNEKGELTGVLSEQAIGLALSKYSLPNPEDFNKAA